MIFGTMDRMGSVLIEQTAEIAGGIVAGGTTAAFAAKEARKVMAELLGLKSLNFELTQTAGVVNGIEISFELKDEPTNRHTAESIARDGRVAAEAARGRMRTMADGEAR